MSDTESISGKFGSTIFTTLHCHVTINQNLTCITRQIPDSAMCFTWSASKTPFLPLEALSTFWGNCKAPLEVHCCTWRLTETCQDLLIFEPSLSPSTKTLRKGWISREICEMHEMHTYGACLAKSSLYGSAQLVSPPLSQKLGGAKGELQGSGILMA